MHLIPEKLSNPGYSFQATACHDDLSPTVPSLQTFPHDFLTCQDGKPPHSRERVIPRGVQDVQLVHISPDVVDLAVKILNGGSVLVLKPAIEKA